MYQSSKVLYAQADDMLEDETKAFTRIDYISTMKRKIFGFCIPMMMIDILVSLSYLGKAHLPARAAHCLKRTRPRSWTRHRQREIREKGERKKKQVNFSSKKTSKRKKQKDLLRSPKIMVSKPHPTHAIVNTAGTSLSRRARMPKQKPCRRNNSHWCQQQKKTNPPPQPTG